MKGVGWYVDLGLGRKECWCGGRSSRVLVLRKAKAGSASGPRALSLEPSSSELGCDLERSREGLRWCRLRYSSNSLTVGCRVLLSWALRSRRAAVRPAVCKVFRPFSIHYEWVLDMGLFGVEKAGVNGQIKLTLASTICHFSPPILSASIRHICSRTSL